MSSKSTLLTTGIEHWYTDCQSMYYEDTKENDAIVLNFNPEHKVETDRDGTTIVIEKGTALYDALLKQFRVSV